MKQGRILEAGEIPLSAGRIPPVFLPERALFARRAERLRLLSKGHPIEGYLGFLALLADAQQGALEHYPPPKAPSPTGLDAKSRRRDPYRKETLDMILQRMKGASLPPQALEAIADLEEAGEDEIDAMANRVLTADFDALSPRTMPFVAAALQVQWVLTASGMNEELVDCGEKKGRCPVCGSPPVSAVVETGGAKQGLRYLCCSLCATRWHVVRLTCSSCGATEGVGYHALEGASGGVKAESCGVCESYLKLLYLEKDAGMEPMADDLATLALDMLMDAEKKRRIGPNLFLHPGT